MPRVERFEDLGVWQASCQLAVGVYQMSNVGEFARDFGLRDQVRRAAVSVPSNIAEGFERRSDREFHRFLSYSKGSLGEVHTQLHIAKEVGYLKQEVFDSLKQQVQQLSRQIGAFMRYLEEQA